MSRADVEARLERVRTAIDRAIESGVTEFQHEGGDGATMISLADLQRMEQALIRQLAAYKGRTRFNLLRPFILAGLIVMSWTNQTIMAGAGIEPVVIKSNDSARRTPSRTYHPPYSGATITRNNYDFMPPHRSGDGAIRESWDLLTRRVRWMVENEPLMRRMISLLAQYVVGEGIGVYSAAIDHVPLSSETSGSLIDHPLFQFGDESDLRFERWAEDYADVERQKSLWEMQLLSAKEVFGAGNSLWLECRKRSAANMPTLCYQLLEAEQLDRSMDRPASPGRNRISNGIEYDPTNEPVAYWLFDAHPYDDTYAAMLTTRSRRIPAARIAHLYLPSRSSQHFGASLANCALQTCKDADWLVGHELTAAALAAGLTLLIKESDETRSVTLDTEDDTTTRAYCYGEDGIPHLSDVGLTSGSVATVGEKESVEVVESKRPGPLIEPFVRFLSNRVSMSGDLSWHRFTGDPTGASFATLRAMINDDRAMALPITYSFGRKIAVRPRKQHDRICSGMGLFSSVTAQQYLREEWIYQEYDVLGPPLRNLNPVEDAESAKARISAGLSTLRIECALLGLSYRRVMRQLAVERDLAAALRLALDFSNGGGQSGTRTTTDASPAPEVAA